MRLNLEGLRTVSENVIDDEDGRCCVRGAGLVWCPSQGLDVNNRSVIGTYISSCHLR